MPSDVFGRVQSEFGPIWVDCMSISVQFSSTLIYFRLHHTEIHGFVPYWVQLGSRTVAIQPWMSNGTVGNHQMPPVEFEAIWVGVIPISAQFSSVFIPFSSTASRNPEVSIPPDPNAPLHCSKDSRHWKKVHRKSRKSKLELGTRFVV